MKPFNLEVAKAGAALITRDGRSARIICYDRITGKWPGPIIALVLGHSQKFENIVYYNTEGQQIDHIRNLDLMINN